MAEPYLRQSALAHRGLRSSAGEVVLTAGVSLSERPFRVWSGKAADRGSFVVENLEHRVELGDLQQVLDTLTEAE